MTRLIIARHGNTFGPGDTPTRVGARTDLPLVESGIKQARHIGAYFKHHQIIPDVVYTSELKRARQTAEHTGLTTPITQLACFNEIDYGPDENKPEPDVIARVGTEALDAWNQDAVVPPGWLVDPQAIIQSWLDFGAMLRTQHTGQTVFVVTSNGIARFAPCLTGDFKSFCEAYSIKLKTGALASFSHINNTWTVDDWNINPQCF
jgi:2,3-bisphosphoglycerate-dependent phosphoglycerate mutase